MSDDTNLKEVTRHSVAIKAEKTKRGGMMANFYDGGNEAKRILVLPGPRQVMYLFSASITQICLSSTYARPFKASKTNFTRLSMSGCLDGRGGAV